MTRALHSLLVALLLATLGAALAPTAQAHECEGNAFGIACGPCAPGTDHSHSGLSGPSFCSSGFLFVCYIGLCLPP